MIRSNRLPVAYGLFCESKLNWLALGLLLAAWNFSDNDCVNGNTEVNSSSAHRHVVTVRNARARDKYSVSHKTVNVVSS